MHDSRFAPPWGPRTIAAVLLATATAFATPALAQARMPDLTGWQSLLDRYVVRSGDGKAQPFDTRFDYEQLYVDEGIWAKRRSERLELVRAQLFAVQPALLEPRQRLAWAINAYNFLVIERATMHLLVPLRRFQRYESVEQMNTLQGTFFDGQFLDFEGRLWSIAEFERAFVYGDSTPLAEPRVRAGDPRVMFALCRGSVGGPPLPVRAFKPESLETQLDQAARTALARPATARWDERVGTLLVSNYLAQRRVDFGGTTAAIVPFLLKHAPGPLRSQIKRARLTDVTHFTPVEPTLNQVIRTKPAVPTEAPETKS